MAAAIRGLKSGKIAGEDEIRFKSQKLGIERRNSTLVDKYKYKYSSRWHVYLKKHRELVLHDYCDVSER